MQKKEGERDAIEGIGTVCRWRGERKRGGWGEKGTVDEEELSCLCVAMEKSSFTSVS